MESNTKIEAKRRAINKWGAIEKSPILLPQYWENDHFYKVSKIISHFDGSNNIFTDCTYLKILLKWIITEIA